MVRSLLLTAGKWVFVSNGRKGSYRSVGLTLVDVFVQFLYSFAPRLGGEAKVSLGDTAEGSLQ